MPSAFVVQIADAVIAELNSASRSWHTPTATFTAVRGWVPVFDDNDADSLLVRVVPLTIGNTQLTRTTSVYQYAIAVVLEKDVTPETTSDIDALVKLLEDIGEFYGDGHAVMAGYKVTGSDIDPVFDPEQLYQNRHFEGVLNLTIQGQR